MKIRFVGSRVTRRVVLQYEWSRETGFVQDVAEPDLAATLLTAPSGHFVVDSEEPLCTLNGIGPQRAAELTLAGIGGLGDLVGLSGAAIKRLAKGIWASERQVKEWVQEAGQVLSRAEIIETEEEQDV